MFLKCLDFTEEDSNENSNVYVKFALCIINPNESTFNHVESNWKIIIIIIIIII